jgi:hypothetical protein
MAAKTGESKELARLKGENERLRAENMKLAKNSSAKSGAKPRGLARRVAVVTLIIIATALLCAGNLLFWFGNTIVKPDRFIAATEPIIKDPKVQQAMALYTTNNIFDNFDVQKSIEQALPQKADFLAPQLSAQLKTGTQKTLQTFLAKPAFQEKWNTLLAKQHKRIINFASKYNGDGTISLNDIFTQLTQNLKSTKLAFLANKQLPSKVGSITVVNATWLPVFHNVVVNIDTWRLLAILFFVLASAGAVLLSRNKRKTVYSLCITVSTFLLASLIAVRFTREHIAEQANAQYADGVRSALQIFFHPFVIQTATIFCLFLVVGLVAWVSGSSRAAISLRNQVGLLFSGKLHTRLFGDGSNQFADWIGRNKRLLEWLAVSVLAILMLLVRLTLKSLILYVFALIVVVLAIEVVGVTSTERDLQKN